MDQRLFLAIALSMLVLIGYYLIFPPPTPKNPSQEPPVAGSETSRGDFAPAQSESVASLGTAAQREAPASVTDAAIKGRLIEIQTPLYSATINTRGGNLTRFELTNYRVAKESIDWGDLISPLRQFIDKAEIDPYAQVDMATTQVAGKEMFALRFIGEDSLSRQYQQKIFTADRKAIRLYGGDGQTKRLVLTASGPDGLTVEKTFTFHPDSYVVDYQLAVINYGKEVRQLRIASLFGEGPPGAKVAQRFGGHQGPMWREDGDVDTEDADDISGNLIVREPDWLGITDTYFLTVAQANSQISHAFYEAEEVLTDEDSVWIASYGIELPQVELQPNKMVTSDMKVYLGPKKVTEMQKFGAKLEDSLDLTLEVLARPMLALMRWFYGFTGNYGVAIILLTVVVRVLLFPLTYKGMTNIKRMQKLQPRIVTLRAKFKKDKERLNKEMMALYKKHKMNPLGGCLPIALQMPIFFALYWALLSAIELRHEPFIFWITDLSSKDGLYITPLLMGGSMFVQQRLTPASMDPTQAKIMMWMPVIFMFFMMGFPAGLVLYWLTSNLLSIAQQLLINRIKVPEPVD